MSYATQKTVRLKSITCYMFKYNYKIDIFNHLSLNVGLGYIPCKLYIYFCHSLQKRGFGEAITATYSCTTCTCMLHLFLIFLKPHHTPKIPQANAWLRLFSYTHLFAVMHASYNITHVLLSKQH